MIDPAIQAFVTESERFYPPDASGFARDEQRRLYDRYARAFAVNRSPTIHSSDAVLALPDRSLSLRLYRPELPQPGIIIYAHGGGFTLGSLDSHDGIVARVAERAGVAVVAVDYRLAPEHRAPAAQEDVLVVVEAALDGRLPWPDLSSRVALMGDSAGATLVASAALRVGRTRPGAIRALGLVYPALGFEPAEPARSVEAEAPMLTLAEVHFYRSVYLDGQNPPDATFVLDEPDLAALPPTVLLPAEHDPLRDDCSRLAARLQACGTTVLLLPGTGLVHGCLRALDRAPAIAIPFGQMVQFLAERLGAGSTGATAAAGASRGRIRGADHSNLTDGEQDEP